MTTSHRATSFRGETLAHRRPGTHEARGLGARGHRRARRHRSSLRVLPVLLGTALLGIGALAAPGAIPGGLFPDGTGGGSAADPVVLTSLPRDAPEQGLVYGGLAPAGPRSICAGQYEIGEQTCTHGPDTAPAGLAVRRDVGPVTAKAPEPRPPRRESAAVPPDEEIARDEGGSALTAGAPALIPDAAPGEADFVLGNHDVACEGDGRSGKRVQVLYLHENGTAGRYADFLGSIRTWAAGVDAIYDASAAETGGSRHIRFVTNPECRVDVSEVEVPDRALGSFRSSIDALQKLGYNRTDRKYLIFADANVYCGIATYVADNRPGQGNRNNGGPSYGRVDAGCWSAQVAAIEVTHMFGALLRDSPNSTGAGSCTDDYDLLCGPDRSGTPVRAMCPKKHENRLDCGHDDYFNTNPMPGSYLAKNWNIADSAFLLRSDGGDDLPNTPDPGQEEPSEPQPTAPATPAPATTPPQQPAPQPTVTTSPGLPDGGGDAPPTQAPTQAPPPPDAGVPSPQAPSPGAAVALKPVAFALPERNARDVQAVLEIRDPTSTSVRLMWSAAAKDARYDVEVDGVPVGSTVATRARLIGLRPDHKYTVTITAGKLKYRARSSAQTAPAARPAQNSWFVLTNSLTGGAGDLYAARTRPGTPIVLGGADGDAQQQWKLAPAGGNTYALVSRATGRCVVPLGGKPVAGAPLVQGECWPDVRQRWTLSASENGFTLRTVEGDLVAGVGKQRYGAHRLLVLQPGNGSRQQSWTAVPG